ncbi:MAG TPA: YtxH domain-containing protein [Candidatus Methanoperedens sp.]|nr:YtxH domain-containing protein [Candidatus Methanoperedens sp.]
MSKTGKFFLAGMLGAVAGAVGGLLLAPQSGKKTRREIVELANEIALKIKTKADDTRNQVKDIYGKYTEEGKTKYLEIKDAVVAKVATIKTAGEEIDREKYGKVVEDVVADFKEDLEATKTGSTKIINYLKKDWEKIKKAIA